MLLVEGESPFTPADSRDRVLDLNGVVVVVEEKRRRETGRECQRERDAKDMFACGGVYGAARPEIRFLVDKFRVLVYFSLVAGKPSTRKELE